jgi:hypothetical protein
MSLHTDTLPVSSLAATSPSMPLSTARLGAQNSPSMLIS